MHLVTSHSEIDNTDQNWILYSFIC